MQRKTSTKAALFNADNLKSIALSTGFTASDVAAPWFTEMHLHAVKVLGKNVSDVRGLALHRLKGLVKNLSRVQVEDKRFTEWHAKAVEKGLPYDQIINVPLYKLRCCVENDLALEQVNPNWFSPVHAEAIQNQLPYDAIANKSESQVHQLIAEYKAMNDQLDHFEIVAEQELTRYFNENPDQRSIFQATSDKKPDDENPIVNNHQKNLS